MGFGSGYKRVEDAKLDKLDELTDVIVHARKAEKKYKTIFPLVSLVIIALLCVVMGITVKERQEIKQRDGSKVLISIARSLMAVMNEAMYSYYYSSPDYIDDKSFTLLEKDNKLAAFQQESLKAIKESVVESVKMCPTCSSFFETVHYTDLISAQSMVKRREFNSIFIHDVYDTVLNRLSSANAYYIGVAVDEFCVKLLAMINLVSAVGGLGRMGQSWDVALDDTQAFPQAFNLTALYLTLMNKSTTGLLTYAQVDTSIGTAFSSKIKPYMDGTQKTMSLITGKFDTLQVVGAVPVDTFVSLMTQMFEQSVQFIGATKEFNANSVRTLDIRIALLAVSLVFLVVVNMLMLYDLFILVFSPERGTRHLKELQYTDDSFAHMVHFLDCMNMLDLAGMHRAAKRSRQNPNRTLAEEELMKLEQPVRNIFTYLNPCILARRRRPSEEKAGGEGEAAAEAVSAASSKTANVLDSQSRPKSSAAHGGRLTRHFTVATMLENNRSGYLAAMGSQRALNGQDIQDPRQVVPLALKRESICVLMADLGDTFCGDINADTAKMLPKMAGVFVRTLADAARRRGGTAIGPSGSIFMVGWNVTEAKVPAAGNSACLTLLNLHDSLLRSHPDVRYAVLTAECPGGVVGSDTLRSYVMSGPLLPLGRTLLNIAHLHNAQFVVDNATALAVDRNLMHLRALEKVALHPRCVGMPGYDTIAFEMTLGDPRQKERIMLWNAAFDDLHAGFIDEARKKMARWSRKYGVTTSSKRVGHLIDRPKAQHACTYAIADAEQLDTSILM